MGNTPIEWIVVVHRERALRIVRLAAFAVVLPVALSASGEESPRKVILQKEAVICNRFSEVERLLEILEVRDTGAYRAMVDGKRCARVTKKGVVFYVTPTFNPMIVKVRLEGDADQVYALATLE
jgi:hypothetical protein